MSGPATVSRWSRARIAMFGVVFIALGVLVVKRAFELQVQGGDRMRGLAEDNYLREIQIPPGRGRILDRNGKELATTLSVPSVFANPRVLAGVPGADAQLAAALSLDKKIIRERLAPTTADRKPRYFAWLKRRVTDEEARRVAALKLPGVGFRPEPRRFYPLRDLGGTVLGHAGSDGRGLEGVELAYEKYLRGQAATLHGIRDALGRELLIDGVADTPEVTGQDVTLSLDSYLTVVTETALRKAVVEHGAKAATAVMIDPRNGDILALANWPGVNPNQPEAGRGGDARNRAITDTFEPGSTMKTFTYAAAFEARRIAADEMFDCELGRMNVGRFTIKDTHPLAVVTVREAYQQSSNICAVKIGRRVGKEALHAMLLEFGFGSAAGIGLPGERRGIVRPAARWGEIGLATASFGQGLTATPMQITAGFAVIATGGIYRAPRLGLRVSRTDGGSELLTAINPAERRVVSERAAQQMLEIMAGVPTAQGTAKLAAVPGYRVAGKTGTAQKVSGGAYDPDKWLASFIGIAPVDNPRFVLGVFIDEPHPVHLGGKVAAPVFREIAEAALKYMNVPPSQTTDEIDHAAVAIGGTAGDPAAEGTGTGDDDFGGPGWTQAAGGDRGEELGSDAIVPLTDEEFFPIDPELPETEQVHRLPATVPNLSGLSIARAIEAAGRAGLDLVIEGSGVAVTQSPAPERAVPRGEKLHVTFRPAGG